MQQSIELRAAIILLCVASVGCSNAPVSAAAGEANAGIDSLNASITQAYRTHDPKAYATLFTESAIFEWPAFNTVRGRAGLEEMARSNWATLKDMDLKLTVSARQIGSDHAAEFGAFEQSWRDPKGVRMAEFGRYVQTLGRQGDNRWRIEHFFGFEDSTRSLAKQP